MNRVLSAHAGFPSPAEDYFEEPLDLTAQLVRNPAATFYMRVRGNCMAAAGIAEGDLLVVDRSLEPQDGSIVVATADGGFIVRRFRRAGEDVWLEAAAEDSRRESCADIWGVVAHVVRTLAP
jgi:DNA polymerase V